MVPFALTYIRLSHVVSSAAFTLHVHVDVVKVVRHSRIGWSGTLGRMILMQFFVKWKHE